MKKLALKKNGQITVYNEELKDTYCLVTEEGQGTKELMEKAEELKKEIEIIPADKRTLSQNPSLIEKIDNPTEQECLEAINSNAMSLKFIKNPSKSIIEKAISLNGCTIQYVDQTYELCKIAVKSISLSIQLFDEKFVTDELIDICLKGGIENFLYLPKSKVTKKMIDEALSGEWVEERDIEEAFGKGFIESFK